MTDSKSNFESAHTLAARAAFVDRAARSSGQTIGTHFLYDLYMTELAVSEARSRLAEMIDEARRSGEPVTMTKYGRRVAVILSVEAFDRLVDVADDTDDRRELAAARDEDDYVPWDEVKAELGMQ